MADLALDHDALCWLRLMFMMLAVFAHLMLMMLFTGCALPAASCNTGAAGAHDARGSCPRPRVGC